ncbi:autotransporter domain-containing protein [Pseudomonas reidholzensis]|uniref:autotransporter domain-containing protein n=1 Tax=Pseudomonas reidholzensis TaxID=1785162 RepID=UPI0039EE0911
MVGNALALGQGALVVGGASTLGSNADLALANNVTLNAGLTVDGSNDLTLAGVINGTGGLVKQGSGNLTLNGVNGYQGGTELAAGTLTLGNAGALGSAGLTVTADATLANSNVLVLGNQLSLANGATLTFDVNQGLTVAGDIAGSGNLIKTGSDELTLLGSKTFSGDLDIQAGAVTTLGSGVLANVDTVNIGNSASLNLNGDASLGSLTGTGSADIVSGTLSLGSNNTNSTFGGAFSGAGNLDKVGSGTLTLSGISSIGGTSQVSAGTLKVDGTLASAGLTVNNGASLSGSGTVDSQVTIANGGHLVGQSGSVLSLGSLALNSGSIIDVGLASPVTGGTGLFDVAGALTLDGTLNVSNIGGFGNGIYRIFDYGGALINNGLAFGSVPNGITVGDLQLQDGVANQINVLVNAAGFDVLFWDGSQTVANGAVDGGNGTWNAASTNWTDLNGTANRAWGDTFAVFQGTAGDVTVEGSQTVNGLQFVNNGFRLLAGTAGALNLINSTSSGDTSVRVDPGVTATLDVALTGNGTLNKLDSGTLVLNGANSYSGGTTLSGGTLIVGSDSALGTGALAAAAGTTLDNSQAVTLANAISLAGPLNLTASNDLTLNGDISGSGGLAKFGTSTLRLGGNNSYLGITALNAGTLLLASDTALGGSTLNAAAGTQVDTTQAVSLASNNVNLAGAFSVLGSNDLELGGIVSGSGRLLKAGSARLGLLGANSYSGGTELQAGSLVLGNNSALGTGSLDVTGSAELDTSTAVTVANAVNVTGTLDVLGSNDLQLSGVLGGNGTLNKVGLADLTLSGNNTFSGILNIIAGSLSTLGTTALGTQSELNVSSGAILNLDGNTTLGEIGGNGTIDIASGNSLSVAGGDFDGAITGSGSLFKYGNARFVLNGLSSFTGATTVNGGSLTVDGSLASTNVAINSGTSLDGSGTLSGAVSVADGASVAGNSGATLSVGSLALSSGSTLEAGLGAPLGGAALIDVAGNLTLDGTLNVTDLGGFGNGVYSLIDYTGTLQDNGLAIGTTPVPSTDLTVQTSVANQVNLVVGGSSNLLFWDGSQTVANGQIDGGTGTWDGTASNWTDANGTLNSAWNDTFAIFQGTAGTVTVNGSQSISGLQFATDGYVLNAGSAGELIAANGGSGQTNVRVDNGVTATVNVAINGSGTLAKLDTGTLVLNAANGYSGGTALNGGTLVLGNNSALGSGTLTAAGGTTLDSNTAITLANSAVLNGALTLAGSNALTLNGGISGAGGLVKNGAGQLTLGGANSYTGGTQINAGSVVGNSSSLQGAIVNNAALTFEQNANGSYTGNLTGSGTLTKNGTGELLLTGTNGLTGNTLVNAGSLLVNGRLDSANVQVASGATLGGSGTLAGAVNVQDGASLSAGSANTALSVGSLTLASGSVLDFDLGAAAASTTVVNVAGNLSLDGTLNITDAGGFGTGVYQLFSYGGSLTDNGLAIGAIPGSVALADLALQTAIANQINLVVGGDDGSLLFWNGSKTTADGTISGGSGTWGTASNWTNTAGTSSDTWADQFAVFGGQAGTVTVAGNQAFTGLQFLTDGYQLVAGTNGSLSPVNAADGSLAAVRVNSGASTLISAPLTGSGGIEKLDAGTLVLAGANTYTGGTTVSGGTLVGNTTSLQGNILNNASLIFQQAADGTYGGALSGTGTTTKTGTGNLLLTGANPFSGAFNVNQGVLEVGNADNPGASLAAQVTVGSGAGLSGNGTVASLTNNGTVLPAGGNLNVTGNFTNGANGTLVIALNSDTVSSLNVGGTANLGGSLQVASLDSGDGQYTVVTAGGGVNGTFATTNLSSSAFIDSSLDYGANQVTLNVSRNDTSFTDVAATGNQQAVAGALQSAGAPASLQNTILTLDEQQARSAFDSLSGEIHASTATVLIEDSRYIRDAVNDRMRQADCSTQNDPRRTLAPTANQQMSSEGCQGQAVGWIRALGGWGDYDGNSNHASVDRELSGFILGVDRALDDQWKVGVAAGYTRTSIDAKRRSSDASVDSYHLATYLNYQLDAFAARLGAGYTWHEIDTKRDVQAGAYDDRLKAKYKARSAQVFGEVGYAIDVGGVAVEPFAGLAYVNYDSDTGREKGGAGRLAASVEQDVTFSTLGVRAGKRIKLDNGSEVTPRLSVGWRHAFGDTKPNADVNFVEGGAGFSVEGVPIARDAAVVEAGVDLSVGESGKLGLGYSGQLSSESRDHGVVLSFSMGF